MNYTPLLYIGVAASLVEAADIWMVKMADEGDQQERLTELRSFPRRDLNAYHLKFHDSDRTVFSFRTGALVNEDRIRATITARIGTPPTRLTTHLEPISALDHRRALVNCALPELFLDWHELLGESWRMLLENELDYFALIRYDYDDNDETGTFTMLSPMLEFARTKYRDSEQHEWEVLWLNFWRQCVKVWDQLLSGRLPDTIDRREEQRGA